MPNKPWLQPNLLTEAEKARLHQIAREHNMTLEQVMAQLDKELAAKQGQSPKGTPAQRTEPRLIEERPEPQVVYERPTPRVMDEPEPAPPSRDGPDPRLVEIAKLWPWLSERDRQELHIMTRMKVQLNQKAAK